MIAEAGLAALWLGAALCLLQLIAAVFAVRGEAELAGIVRPVAVAQAALTALAFGLLIWLFVRVDLSVALVFENDHSEKPLLYRFAATWGNHEGSMLMWVAILGMAGAAVALFERKLEERTLLATLGGQAVIGLGFYAFLLFASNPFARLYPVPPEGRGLPSSRSPMRCSSPATNGVRSRTSAASAT